MKTGSTAAMSDPELNPNFRRGLTWNDVPRQDGPSPKQCPITPTAPNAMDRRAGELMMALYSAKILGVQ